MNVYLPRNRINEMRDQILKKKSFIYKERKE